MRERQVITLEEAVRKMTSLPAAQFGFADRGAIAAGQAADLVCSTRRRVADRATYDQPHQYPDGIAFVLVNGVAVVAKGAQTPARPGQVRQERR